MCSFYVFVKVITHVFAKVVAVVDRTRQQKSTLLSLYTDSVICQSYSMYLSKLLHVFVKVVAVVDRTRQQKSTLLSLDTDSVTTLAFMATSGGHQGGKRILFLGIVAHVHTLRIFFYRVRS